LSTSGKFPNVRDLPGRLPGERTGGGRLIMVSNRLPFTIGMRKGQVVVKPSAGGLVTGLQSFLEKQEEVLPKLESCLWVGWPGSTIHTPNREEITAMALKEYGSLPVYLSQSEMDHFYHGFCNKTIWPLFHYFPSYTHYNSVMWHEYVRVNEHFADIIAAEAGPADRIWIHDYQLMLLPAMLRTRLPGRSIGFFLHIPFPSFELFRLLPGKWRREILSGLLGADLVGFHTYEYTQHFLQCALRILDHSHHLGTITLPSHIVKAQTFPLGIDFAKYHDGASSEETAGEAAKIRQSLGQRKIILSVDRLDYTKGILNRLEAFELLLDKHPAYAGNVVLVLTVVPSRVAVEQYGMMKRHIEETVGKINGRFGEIGWTPVVYRYRNLPFGKLTALYSISDVALVTPLRDGMNLVAKEYVAARADGEGVLVLSEMAGAVKELGEAIVVNPNDRRALAEAMHEALSMPPLEQRRRIAVMQGRLKRYTVDRWANDFLTQLDEMSITQARYLAKVLGPNLSELLVQEYRGTKKRLFLLDYDGTLVGFHERPRMAVPTPEVLLVLKSLCDDPRNVVAIVSGRDRDTLWDFFEGLGLTLVAEHGVWLRDPGKEWRMTKKISSAWKPDLLPILQLYTDRLPGALIEEKGAALAWHYRKADPEQAQVLVGELMDHLTSFTANTDLQIMQGNKVMEIRSAGVNKGTAVAGLLQRGTYDFILSIGDDWTDEDVFRMLPPGAHSVKVGVMSTHARYNVRDPEGVLDLLRTLANPGD